MEALAKRRLPEEYATAQARGEVSNTHDGPGAGVLGGNAKATVTDLGLARKPVYEARRLHDAEKAEPGVIRRIRDDCLAKSAEL